MLGKRLPVADGGSERIPVNRARGLEVGHCDGNVVETAKHQIFGEA